MSATEERSTAAAGLAGPAAAPEPHEQLGRSFKAAMASVRRLRGRETHHPEELSYAQYGLLFSLSGADQMSARDLADAAALIPGTATQMLDGLEAAGLVRRIRSADDKRVVLISLTDRGGATVSRTAGGVRGEMARSARRFQRRAAA